MAVMHPDVRIAEVARRQHGVLTREQLVEAGLGRRAIERRLETGRLHRLHRGVYLLGHPVPTEHARYFAAVAACGNEACLSRRSAADLWGLPTSPSKAAVDVTIPARKRVRRPGIRTHQTDRLDRSEVTKRHGIRVTIPARTLLDLAEVAAARELERAFDEALTRGLIRTSQVKALIDRHPHRRGTAVLKRLLQREHGTTMTRSQAEEIALGLVRAARLPHPDLNARVAGRELDMLWRDHGVGVEIDGYGFHGRTRAQFEDDHAKDAALDAVDLRVIHVTYRQLTSEREAVVARLARALARAHRTASG